MGGPAFDSLEGQIWYNGEWVDWKDAKLHVLTHGLHYASCVFEGERMYSGKIFELRAHTQRLFDSAQTLGFKIPYSLEEIDQACIDACKKNSIVNGYIRPVAWRGSEMMGVSAQHNRINVAVAAWDWPSYFSPELREKGIKLETSKWRRPAAECAPVHAKAAGLYMICTLSKHAAEGRGCQDALMLDYRGYVAEATGANIFIRFKGEENALHTPTPDCFLNGITRQTVIQLAKARGVEIIERHIKPGELKNAVEIFLTGSAAEVTPVGQIDALTFTPGKITHQLNADYEKAVGKAPESAATE